MIPNEKNSFLRRSLIHDIEILPNFFSDIFKPPGTNNLIIAILYEDEDFYKLHPDLQHEIRWKNFPDYPYVEIDSIMPQLPEYEFLKDTKYRIKTRKFRGQISMGLVLPITVLEKYGKLDCINGEYYFSK